MHLDDPLRALQGGQLVLVGRQGGSPEAGAGERLLQLGGAPGRHQHVQVAGRAAARQDEVAELEGGALQEDHRQPARRRQRRDPLGERHHPQAVGDGGSLIAREALGRRGAQLRRQPRPPLPRRDPAGDLEAAAQRQRLVRIGGIAAA